MLLHMVIHHRQHERDDNLLGESLVPFRAQTTLVRLPIAEARGLLVHLHQTMELLSSRVQEELAVQDQGKSALRSVDPDVFAIVLDRKEHRPLQPRARLATRHSIRTE